MDPYQRPIGFEGILSNTNNYSGAYESLEAGQTRPPPAYPLNDTMPIPSPTVGNNIFPSTSPKVRTYSEMSFRNELSYLQLLAIYQEIVNEWQDIKWLRFINNSKQTHLILYRDTNEYLTVQMAIDQNYLTTGSTLLSTQPECLLIRTKTNSRCLFAPNSLISIENLLKDKTAQRGFRYQLLAIICDSKQTEKTIMFYRHNPTNSWYAFFNEQIPSLCCHQALSDKENNQLESYIQRSINFNSVDPSRFHSPLSALNEHPIVYVYLPAKY